MPLSYDDYMDARVYVAEDQPRVGGVVDPTVAAPAPSALSALQNLTGSKDKITPKPETHGGIPPGLSPERVEEPLAPPEFAAATEGEFEGFEDESDEVGVLELKAGDLVLIDPGAGRWAVVQEDPEADAEDEVFLDLVDWSTGEPEGVSLSATEMVHTRRVLQEA